MKNRGQTLAIYQYITQAEFSTLEGCVYVTAKWHKLHSKTWPKQQVGYLHLAFFNLEKNLKFNCKTNPTQQAYKQTNKPANKRTIKQINDKCTN
jgi:hypothetical protein